MARKRYIAVEDRNPFGEEFDERILQDPAHDSTFIEGYSDVRREREVALAEGKRSPPLRHRLQLARSMTIDGSRSDGRRMEHWTTKKGYRPIKWEEAIEQGYRVDKNPAFTKDEDGNVRHGNGTLMVADAKVAAANLKRVQRDTAELMEQPRQRLETAVERFNRETKGAHAEAFSFLGDEDPDEIAKGKRKKK